MSAGFHTYVPPGPVAASFLSSNARVRAIMGPVGSGKTGACLMEMLYRAFRQEPGPDGWRRTKFAVVRASYRDLEKTTIKSWLRWMPKEMGHWIGGTGGAPAVHTVQMGAPNGGKVELIVEFIGLGENKVENMMPGWEGTGVYLNEADKLSEDTLTYVRGRVGRYPAVDVAAGFKGATWRGVWMDFNAPDTDHWLYARFIDDCPPGWSFFRQPGARQAGAENLANLVEGYYSEQMDGQPKWYVQRMIDNLWGFSREGEPVYEEYNDALHVAAHDLAPIPGLPLVIGGDAGLTPAAIITQRTPFGQLRVLDELVADKAGMGARRFGELLNALLAERYPGFRKIVGWGDPAAAARASTDESTWLQVMAAVTGFPWRPAPSNALTMRLEAVRLPLTQLLDGQPGFLLSPRCKIVRKGFNSGYRMKRLAVAGGDRFGNEPDKNEYSHPHDGLQYAALGHGIGHEVLERKAGRARSSAPVMVSTDFDVFGGGR